MPIVLSTSIMTLSRVSHGSLCTIRSSDWKKRASYGMFASNTTSDASMNVVAGGPPSLAACESGYSFTRLAYATAFATPASPPVWRIERSSAYPWKLSDGIAM
jgi:hypothetical protein